MFCLKCGELIPDDSEKCPNCGASIGGDNEQAVIFASQKEPICELETTSASANNKTWLVIIGLAVTSFIFLALNYMSVSIDLLYYGSSDTNYTGYYLTECLGGTARLSGIMVILLIVLNIATIITATVGMKKSELYGKALKKVLLSEVILYLFVTTVPYFHISNLLKEFDSSLSTTSIGIGCYLNIGVAILMAITYFSSLSKQLGE